MTIFVVIDHDHDPDFSWLEQDCYDPHKPGYDPIYRTKDDADAGRDPINGDWYRDPANHVALTMVAYDDGDDADCDQHIVDSCGGIDLLADSDDWKTGTFWKLSQLDRYPYLRELAEEMGVR